MGYARMQMQHNIVLFFICIQGEGRYKVIKIIIFYL